MKTFARFRAFTRLGSMGLLLASASVFAEVRVADSIATLQTQINQAAPGDVIRVKNGTYTTQGPIAVRCRGAAGSTITIAAETVGGVEISGTNGFNITAPAGYVTISGFVLTHASGKNSIGAGTGHVQITRCTFRCVGEGPYLSVAGDDAVIDHNEFADKKTPGDMIAVGGTGTQVAQRLWLHRNFFHDFSNAGANGGEMLRLGISALSLSTGNAVVEHNLFARCRGENDLISNRSSGNTYRYNTFLESPSAQFSLRHGNDCSVYGNVFRHTEGLRLFGDRHRIFSNYFEANYIGINLGNGTTEVAESGLFNGQDRPDNCLIAFNTLIDNRTHYQLSRRATDAMGATGTTFANNILLGGEVAAKIEGPYSNAVWSGNFIWDTTHTGDFPASGYTKTDPSLVAGPDGIRRPQPDSLTAGSAIGDFPMVSFDLDGQARPEHKSRGADEAGTPTEISPVLTEADVGPQAKDLAETVTTPATKPAAPENSSPKPASDAAPAKSEGLP